MVSGSLAVLSRAASYGLYFDELDRLQGHLDQQRHGQVSVIGARWPLSLFP